MTDQNPPVISPDMALAIDILMSRGPDVDFQIVKRDGRIVNVEVTDNYRKQLEKHKLKEAEL